MPYPRSPETSPLFWKGVTIMSLLRTTERLVACIDESDAGRRTAEQLNLLVNEALSDETNGKQVETDWLFDLTKSADCVSRYVDNGEKVFLHQADLIMSHGPRYTDQTAITA